MQKLEKALHYQNFSLFSLCMQHISSFFQHIFRTKTLAQESFLHLYDVRNVVHRERISQNLQPPLELYVRKSRIFLLKTENFHSFARLAAWCMSQWIFEKDFFAMWKKKFKGNFPFVCWVCVVTSKLALVNNWIKLHRSVKEKILKVA